MSWVRVCAADEVSKDTLKVFKVNGVEILVANLGDEHRAYPPVCPHMEEPLEESGMCAGGILTCSKHLWQWDMRSGELVHAAEADEENERLLLMYDLKREGNELLVRLDHELEYDYGEDEDE